MVKGVRSGWCWRAIGLVGCLGWLWGGILTPAGAEPGPAVQAPQTPLDWRYQYRKVRHPQGFWAIELPIDWNMPLHRDYHSVFYSEPIAPSRGWQPKPLPRSLIRLDLVLLDQSMEAAETDLTTRAEAAGLTLTERSTLSLAGRSAVRMVLDRVISDRVISDQVISDQAMPNPVSSEAKDAKDTKPEAGPEFDRTWLTLIPVTPRLSLLLVGSYNPRENPTAEAVLTKIHRSIELFFEQPTDIRTPAQQLLPLELPPLENSPGDQEPQTP